ncbi:hypothetical protein AGMMS50229_12550 [Campylobacterota bacterium]|nr:hypothetical protein AGMMS50229_12550 [Campylobacterota bacterium]
MISAFAMIRDKPKNLKANADTSASPQYDRDCIVILRSGATKNLKANTDVSPDPRYYREGLLNMTEEARFFGFAPE